MRGTRLLAMACLVVSLVVSPLISPGDCHAQSNNRNVNPQQPPPDRVAAEGLYYAVVIGINNYPKTLSSLRTAVGDARAVAELLSKSYGFKTTLLLDGEATRVNILNTINRFRDTLNDNDSLLIYYAGHGFSDRAADKAYWLPVDADSAYSSNRIIADELTTDIRVQNARHVLIISDSCYSGGLARGADSPAQSGGNAAFLNRMMRSRSRTLMASGGDEPVSDAGTNGHSVFAYAVLKSLERTTQTVFTASDLFYSAVRQQVAGKSAQLPQYLLIRNSDHEEGDFVFARSGQLSSLKSSPDTEPADSLNESRVGLPDDASGRAVGAEDVTEIQSLLAAYAASVNHRDMKQLRAVWPEVPLKTVMQYKALPDGARITLELTRANLLEGNENAIVRCRQIYEANGKSQTDSVTFYVGRFRSGWIINQIPSSD